MAAKADSAASEGGAAAAPQPAQAKPANTAAGDASSSEQPESAETRHQQAQGIVRRNVYWTLGVGLVPVPIVDFVGITAIQLKLIKELSDCYGVKFTENTAKSIISSLAVSIGSLGIAEAVAGSLLKAIPIVGTAVGALGVSAVGAAFTLALGNLFIMHFESGGTLLDFDPEKMRAYFQKELEQAKSTVSQMQAEKRGTGPAKSAS